MAHPRAPRPATVSLIDLARSDRREPAAKRARDDGGRSDGALRQSPCNCIGGAPHIAQARKPASASAWW